MMNNLLKLRKENKRLTEENESTRGDIRWKFATNPTLSTEMGLPPPQAVYASLVGLWFS